MTINADIAEYA